MAHHCFRGKLAVVTPTRDRAYSLSLTQKYLERQTAKPDLWIIASEGAQPDIQTKLPMISTHDCIPKLAGKYSLCRNITRAISIAKENNIDGILLMEDDDWYRADYLEVASKLLNQGEVTGIFPVQYLHLTNGNVRLSNAIPFSQMGFTKEAFQDVIDIANRGVALIDQELQKLHRDNKCFLRVKDLYALSLKGMYGDFGVTGYHKTETNFGQRCNDTYEALINFIGRIDAAAYKNIIDKGALSPSKRKNECILFNVTGDGKHYGCEMVMTHLHRLLVDAGINVSRSFRSGHIDKFTLSEIRSTIAGANLIVVNGEGNIHHDSARAKCLALLGKAAKEESIPSALINSTLYENSAETLQNIALYDYISVRESASKLGLRSIGKECDVIPDLTFYTELNPHVAKYVGMARVSDSVRSNVTKRLKEFAAAHGWPQRSIMHPAGKGSVATYINTHAQYGFVVTGRFHDVCFCLNAKIPFVALESNTNKISALLQDVFGDNRRLVVPDELILLKIDCFTEFSSEENRAIDEFKLKARNQFALMKKKLARL